MPNRPVIYWDTCVFLAWIKDEKRRHEGEMAGVYAVSMEVFKKRLILMTSVVTKAEIQQASLTPEQLERFNKIFDLSNIRAVEVSEGVATKAGQLRHYYKSIGDGKPGLCKDDSYHLATAIIYKVAAFHTFDRADKKNCRGLLGLNGDVAGYPLRIVKPQTAQGSLDLRAP